MVGSFGKRKLFVSGTCNYNLGRDIWKMLSDSVT